MKDYKEKVLISIFTWLVWLTVGFIGMFIYLTIK